MAFYKEYLDKVPELFLVAEEEGKIVGLCMGYYKEDNNYAKCFLRHNLAAIFFRCLFLGITFNKALYKKVFKRKKKAIIIDSDVMNMDKTKIGDLLSIGVLAEWQGKGVAQSLMDHFLETIRKHGRECCLLTVEENNARARAFYKRNGFAPCQKLGTQITCARRSSPMSQTPLISR